MNLDPRTPVLVGAGRLTQRLDPPDAAEALDLMVAAAVAAAADAGAPGLLSALDRVAVPEGTWGYTDPGRLVAQRLGAATASTVVMEVGILQHDLFADACSSIAAGDIEVALVVGGEAKHRSLRAAVTGIEAPETTQPEGTTPDRRVTPEHWGVHDLEIIRNSVPPVTQYALIDNALAHQAGLDPATHRHDLTELWARFAAVAAGDELAWDRSGPSAAELDDTTGSNRMLALPYSKRLVSQWNVDQAAALVLCSVAAAERFGVARDRWVFPWASACSNHSVTVVERPELHTSPGADAVAAGLTELTGLGPDDYEVIDIYSCFPSAVQVQAAAFGLPLDRTLTVTGGMTFGGGPLNNYVLQAMAALVPRLRAEPATVGLSTSVSGFLNKVGAGVWSATPPPRPFRHLDVTDRATEAAGPARPVDAELTGEATIVSWTVTYDDNQPTRVVAICDADGRRTIATADDPTVAAALTVCDHIGDRITITPDGHLESP